MIEKRLVRLGTRDEHRRPPAAADDSGQNRQTAANANIPFAERITCTIPEACEVTSLGRTKLYELIGKGQLDTITIGRRRLVVVRSLLKLFGR